MPLLALAILFILVALPVYMGRKFSLKAGTANAALLLIFLGSVLFASDYHYAHLVGVLLFLAGTLFVTVGFAKYAGMFALGLFFLFSSLLFVFA